MTRLLVATESNKIKDQIYAVLDPERDELVEVSEGRLVAVALAEQEIDLVVTDMQIGSMGGVAVCHHLRLEESGGRLNYVPVLLLLDRRADVFLARRCGADGWLIKPLDPLRLRTAIDSILAGERYEDASWQPVPVISRT